MSFLDKLSNSVSKSVYNLGKKSSEMIEVNKLNISISKQEGEMEELYQELGYRVYRHLKGFDYITREDLKEYIIKIKKLEENIETLEKLALNIQDIKYCKDCKVEFDEDIRYCPLCGKRIGN